MSESSEELQRLRDEITTLSLDLGETRRELKDATDARIDLNTKLREMSDKMLIEWHRAEKAEKEREALLRVIVNLSNIMTRMEDI